MLYNIQTQEFTQFNTCRELTSIILELCNILR